MASIEKYSVRHLTAKIVKVFELDLRSLSLFRLVLSLLILNNVITYILNSQHQEINPVNQSTLGIASSILQTWSILMRQLNHFPFIQGFLLLLSGVAAVTLFIGYRTRLMLLISWATTIALNPPNSILSVNGQEALSGILLWSIFLPLGASYSVDRALHSLEGMLPKRIVSGGTLAFTLQIFFLYLFLILTYLPITNTGGNVFFLVLRLIPIFLLIIPVYPQILRICAIFALLIFTTISTKTFGANLYIFLFSLLVFIPSQAWDLMSTRLNTPQRSRLRIYYDADCGFCKKVVHLLRIFLVLPSTPLLIAQGEQSIYVAMQEYNSWVVVDWQQKRHFKFEAIAYIVSLSPLFWPLAFVLKWRPIMAGGTNFYELIAKNRQFAGKFTAYLKFSPLSIYPSKLMNVIPLVILTYVIVFELSYYLVSQL